MRRIDECVSDSWSSASLISTEMTAQVACLSTHRHTHTVENEQDTECQHGTAGTSRGPSGSLTTSCY